MVRGWTIRMLWGISSIAATPTSVAGHVAGSALSVLALALASAAMVPSGRRTRHSVIPCSVAVLTMIDRAAEREPSARSGSTLRPRSWLSP
jgi:hypothetical protein